MNRGARCLSLVAVVSFAVLTALFLPGLASAAHPTPEAAVSAPPPTPPAGQRLSLRVGIYNLYPIIYEKNNLPTGFHLELLKEMADREGWKLEYRFSDSLKNVLDSLEDGSIDLGMGIVPSPQERERLDFTREKNAVLTGQIFVVADRDDIQAMADLNDKTVAYITKGELGAELVRTSEALKVKPIFKEVNSCDEMGQAVATGAVDAGLFNTFQTQRLQKLYDLKPTAIVFPPVEVQYAVRKGWHHEVITTIDRYLHDWKLKNHSAYHLLEHKLLRQVTPEEKQKWSDRQIVIAIGICLLIITVAVMLGNVMHDEISRPADRITKGHGRSIFMFVVLVSASFWILDSLVAWTLFNSDQQMNLLQWTITNVPAENLYVRGMIVFLCCVVGIYLYRYLARYDQLINILVRSVGRFEQLTDNARDMIFRMSLPKGEYEFVSKASSEIFGYSPDEFYKRPLLIRDMVHRDWRVYFSKLWEDALSGKAAPYCEFQVIDKAGRPHWINQRQTLYFNDQGRPYAIEGIITDVTEQRRAQSAAPQPA